MERRTAQITHADHPLNWWGKCVGQFVSVLDEYKPTGYMKIRVVRKTGLVAYDSPYGGIGFRQGTAEEIADVYIDPHYQHEGWIPPEYLRIV